jgi:hypothetical protein
MVTEQSASKLPEMIPENGEVPVVAAVAQLVCAMRRERWPCCARYRASPVHSSSISLLFIYLLPIPRPPITLSCPAALLFTELVTLSTYCISTIFPFVIGRTCRHHFFFSLTSPLSSSPYVHSRTQAGPPTPGSLSCLRTHPFLCPSISPPVSGPVTSSILCGSSLSHAPKSVDCATAHPRGSSQPRAMGRCPQGRCRDRVQPYPGRRHESPEGRRTRSCHHRGRAGGYPAGI